MDSTIKKNIKNAIDKSPRNAYVVELHAQILKYAYQLEGVTGKEFCEALGIRYSYGTEYAKMIKLARRLENTGLVFAKI
jgi:hypothetical protein